MPQAAVEHLKRILYVAIDRKLPVRPTAGVCFATAAPGISESGTAYRMDMVPVSMRAAMTSPHPADEDVLNAIHRHTRISPLPGTLASPV